MVDLDVRRAGITRLEQGLGSGRKYSAEQMQKIDQHIEPLNNYQFCRICEDFINRRKSLPTPGDFEDAVRPYLRQQQKAQNLHRQATEPSSCPHCSGTGYVVHRRATQEAEMNIYARCCCLIGGAITQSLHLPRITSPVECIPVQQEAFIPRKAGESLMEGVQRKAEQWKAKIEISKQYWNANKGVKE